MSRIRKSHCVCLVTSLCVFFGQFAFADPPASATTKLGIFNPLSPESAKDLGATAVRLVISSRMLRERNVNQQLQKLADFHNAGLTVILTHTVHGNLDERVPLPRNNSPEWHELVNRFVGLVEAAGPSIDYLAIDNEPTVALLPIDFAPHPNGQIPAIQLYAELAGRAKNAIQKDAKLAHLKVASPALFNLHRKGQQGNGDGRRAFPIFEWETSDPNIDVIDLHAHVATAEEIDDELTFVRKNTNKPIIITEWSQAGAVKGWLDDGVNPAFAMKWNIRPTQLNREFIKLCYESPVQKAVWDEFVATAPYDPQFMKRAFSTMVRHGVKIATYGAQKQYGSPVFDSKQLLSNLTVAPDPNGGPQENYLFTKWYRELAGAHKSGLLKTAP